MSRLVLKTVMMFLAKHGHSVCRTAVVLDNLTTPKRQNPLGKRGHIQGHTQYGEEQSSHSNPWRPHTQLHHWDVTRHHTSHCMSLVHDIIWYHVHASFISFCSLRVLVHHRLARLEIASADFVSFCQKLNECQKCLQTFDNWWCSSKLCYGLQRQRDHRAIYPMGLYCYKDTNEYGTDAMTPKLRLDPNAQPFDSAWLGTGTHCLTVHVETGWNWPFCSPNQ